MRYRCPEAKFDPVQGDVQGLYFLNLVVGASTNRRSSIADAVEDNARRNILSFQ